MYETWSWHTYSYAFGFVLKTGCDSCLCLCLCIIACCAIYSSCHITHAQPWHHTNAYTHSCIRATKTKESEPVQPTENVEPELSVEFVVEPEENQGKQLSTIPCTHSIWFNLVMSLGYLCLCIMLHSLLESFKNRSWMTLVLRILSCYNNILVLVDDLCFLPHNLNNC